ncbi:hypothetical protein [Romboutsia ilealis]|uniref:hypothetical protein n=1 Tax=Romboutsia ilealis TaxID=1115758 RepID=UPI002F421033
MIAGVKKCIDTGDIKALRYIFLDSLDIDPTFEKYGVLHYSVANMPGAVPRTSTMALSNATLPYILKLAHLGLDALKQDEGFMKGLNTHQGVFTCQAVAEALNGVYKDPKEIL